MPTIAAAAPSDLLPVRFSWDTLPVYFHSQNGTGPWSDDALEAISRYPLATIEKEHGGARAPVSPSSPSSSSSSSWTGVGGGVVGIAPTYEETGAEACRRIAGGASIEDLDFDDDSTADDGGSAGSGTPTPAGIYYLNSVIDWPFNDLHALMVDHPEWRLKNSSAQDILILDRVWGFNLSVPECREAWLADCLDATRAGCSGCYVDKSAEHLWFDDIMSPRDRVIFEEAHLDTLKELNARLTAEGKFAINNNQGLIPEGTTAMMIEDFAATERCVRVLAEVVERGLAVEVHAGYYDDDRDGGNGIAKNRCIGGGTNAVAAFLISAGTKSYYHCSTGWESDPRWPAVPDEWLDWPPMYDRPLGAPRGRAKKVGDVWYRRFGDGGASVAFDGRLGNGTIRWGDGTVQRGRPNGLDQLRDGCKWTDLFATEKEPGVISQPLSLS